MEKDKVYISGAIAHYISMSAKVRSSMLKTDCVLWGSIR